MRSGQHRGPWALPAAGPRLRFHGRGSRGCHTSLLGGPHMASEPTLNSKENWSFSP